MNKYMDEAVLEAMKGIGVRDGGPFGAVIVKDGEIIARGHNEVVSSHDPTAHAEIVVIRIASEKLGRFDLSDCELYTTCEPCPMCYSAIHWAKIKKFYYGATREDAAEIGFDDEYLYSVLSGKREDDTLDKEAMEREHCLEAFDIFKKDQERTMY
ncbi:MULTISPECIES: nucleoside deaminase [unclassified Fusibacter]|uniref:nucleoside deaminase n=1 Tax=unclassified Fusibacter TaxID=2624464 RepID=UPI001010E851|nr:MULTISPECIES: nucleoside deaminase [unclassified Fusibacter]MCK8060938.1 nucleoside deaminase [Fusibacter sp. A2]NPE23234.1 nucleoside deaminase [Fusibacter sp. A1]RXV59588.1 nucleoside deaminase [Fusibacter sp. A1]